MIDYPTIRIEILPNLLKEIGDCLKAQQESAEITSEEFINAVAIIIAIQTYYYTMGLEPLIIIEEGKERSLYLAFREAKIEEFLLVGILKNPSLWNYHFE